MLPVEWSPFARRDLVEIQYYIEQDSPIAAGNFRHSIEDAVETLLPVMPEAFRPGRIAGTREYVVHPNYIVVYRVDSDAIRILRVVHGRRLFPPP